MVELYLVFLDLGQRGDLPGSLERRPRAHLAILDPVLAQLQLSLTPR